MARPTSLESFDAPPSATRSDHGIFSFLRFGRHGSSDTVAAPPPHPPPLDSVDEEELSGSSVFGSSPGSRPPSRASVKPVAPPPTRTLTTVLRRLSTFGKDKDMDHRQYWMPDSLCKECYDCGNPFNALRRRHHCRVCGQIFCWRCCSDVVPGHMVGQTTDQRCCTYCARVIREYRVGQQQQQDDRLLGVSPELAFPGFKSSRQTSDASLSSSPVKRARSSSLFQLPSRSDIFSDPGLAMRIVILFRKAIADGSFELKDHRDRLVTYEESFVASEFVDWLVASRVVRKRSQGVMVGQALLDSRYFAHVRGQEHIFKDEYMLFRVTEAVFLIDDEPLDSARKAVDEDDDNPRWFRQIEAIDPESSDPDDDLAEAASVLSRSHLHEPGVAAGATLEGIQAHPFSSAIFSNHNARPQSKTRQSEDFVMLPTMATDIVPESGAEHVDVDDTALATASFTAAANVHLRRIITQSLNDEGLDASVWTSVIGDLITNITQKVQPKVRRGDKMDIREYIKVKKGPGGSIDQCHYYSGVVFTKHVAHKRMRSTIKRPRIMVLGFALEFQRVANKLLSFDALLASERGYLQNAVAKISALKPDIVVVERAVSRIAQELLLEAGITLMLNVKSSVVKYLARCTQADVIPTMEKLNFEPRLGTCEKFSVKSMQLQNGTKQLAFFEGCQPSRGCTVMLRGGSHEELAKVKRTLLFGAFAAYSLQLQTRFLENEFLCLQLHPDPAPSADAAEAPRAHTPPAPSSHTTGEAGIKRSGSDAASFEPLALKKRRSPPDSAARAFVDALSQVVLSASPFIVFDPPYLLTEGLHSRLRIFLPEVLYSSHRLKNQLSNAPDCLRARTHQSIYILHAMWTGGQRGPCINPHVLKMEYFGRNDVTLGNFIEHYCFQTNFVCPAQNCEEPMERHIRSFTYKNGRILIGLMRLKTPIPNPNPGEPDMMFMWSWCKTCQQVTPVLPMQPETWTMSFAKYLELTFCGDEFVSRGGLCPHTVHHHHVRYFGKGDLTVCFDYEPIDLYEVTIPPRQMAPSRP